LQLEEEEVELAKKRGSSWWMCWRFLSLDHEGAGGGAGLLVVAFGRCKRWWRWWREREKIEDYHLIIEIGGRS